MSTDSVTEMEKTRGDLSVARMSQDLHDALERHARERPKAAALDPKTPRHLRDLGEALMAGKSYDKAREMLEKAVRWVLSQK